MKIIATEILKSIPGVLGIHFDRHAPYTVLEKGDIEIRQYSPMTLASYTQSGPHETAINIAFTKLASYIFGNDIPMTVPVFQELEPHGVTLYFYIAGYEKLPSPESSGIRLQKMPERTVAVYSYSGINTPKNMQKGKASLYEGMRTLQDYVATGKTFWAQYDSPMTIPFLRKNEAMVEIKKLS